MNDERRTARVTGLWYAGLAVTGMVAFLLLRPALSTAGDAEGTLANLVDRPQLSAALVAIELAVVVTQAVAAVWFYRLLRPLNPVAAWAVAGFGLANAVVILSSAVFLSTARTIALDGGPAPAGDTASSVQLLFALSDSAWAAGAVFFGLWLVPMGHVVLTSGRMPRALGWLLVVGGSLYVVSAFFGVIGVDGADIVTLPASLGEFWMIGYLLIVGIRPATRRLDVVAAEDLAVPVPVRSTPTAFSSGSSTTPDGARGS